MVGQTVGKYKIIDRVGRGGMGTVYRALDETLNREVALKVVNAELTDPDVAKRFRAEAITVARLSHPCIATIYDLFQHDGQWLMVMEFVRGETLEHMVERMGALSPQRAAELCMQVLAALAYAHSMGVVHRDLKPANLMITETGAIKIMDFGIARVTGTEHLTHAWPGAMMGTPAYMAPEQVRGDEIDSRADLYAMGVVFYRLTTAKLPFTGTTQFAMAQSQVNDPPTPLATFRSDLPPWVEPVIARALAKMPDERFQSAAEFHEALARSLAGLPLSTMYGSASQGDMSRTPARPTSTGTFAPRTPTATGVGGPFPSSGPVSVAPPTAAGGSGGGAAGTSGSLSLDAGDPADAATVLSPTGKMALRAAAEARASAATASGLDVARAASGTPQTPAASSATTPRAKRPIGVLAAVGAVLVVAAIGAALWLRPGSASPPPPPPPDSLTATPVDPSVELPATPPPAPPPPDSLTATPVVPTVELPATPPAAQPAAPTSPPAQPVAPTSREAPVTRTATPAAVDPLVTFPKVKLLAVNGRKTNDRDVAIQFARGVMSIVPKEGGEALRSLQYRQIAKLTYIKSRRPKWDNTLSSPPDDLDVGGGLLNRSRHWLVVQTKDEYALLRLDDDNVVGILETLEARTGQKVERPIEDGK